MATLREIDEHYSLADVLEVNRYLDRCYAAEKAELDKQKKAL